MTQNRQKNESILKLIRLVDKKFKPRFRAFLFHSPLSATFFSLLILLVVVEIYLLVAPLGEKIIIGLTFATLILGFLAVAFPTFERTIIEDNYNRISKSETDNFQKALLKALIKMKAKEHKISLEEIYKRNKSLFTEEKLLKSLYQ